MLTKVHRLLWAAVLLAAPLAVGGVHTQVVAVLAGGAVAALALQSLDHARLLGRQRILAIPTLAFVLLAGACLLQQIPVPAFIHEFLNPYGWRLVSDGYSLLYPQQSASELWRPLTLAPGNTADRGLRWIALTAAAAYGTQRAQRRGGWKFALRCLVLAGMVVLVAGALQEIVATQKVLFVYEPADELKAYTTFISPNHANLFFGLTSLCGYVLAVEEFEERPLVGVAAALSGLVLMVACFEQRSIGGTAAYAVALGLFVVLFASGRHSATALSTPRRRRCVIGLGALVLLTPFLSAAALVINPPVVGPYLWDSWIGQWVTEHATIRAELLRAGLGAMRDYPLVGSGAGSTEHILPPYVDWSTVPVTSIPTLENEYIEWGYEYGVPVALGATLLLSGYLYYAIRGFRRNKRTRYAAAVAVGAFLLIAALMHFPFFALGISMPAVFLLSTAIFRRKRRSSETSERKEAGPTPRRVRWDWDSGTLTLDGPPSQWVPVGLAVATGVLIAAFFAWPSVPGQHQRQDGTASFEETRRHIITSAPTNGSSYLVAALRLGEGAEGRRVALAEHAFDLEPKANIGLIVALERWRAGQHQKAVALLQRIFSPRYSNIDPAWIAQNLVAGIQDPQAIGRGMAREDERSLWRTTATALRQRGGASHAADFGLALTEGNPRAYLPYEIIVRAYLDMDEHLLAELWARRAVENLAGQRLSTEESAQALLVRTLRHSGKHQQARRLAWEAFAQRPKNIQLARHVVDLRTSDPRASSRREKKRIEDAVEALCAHPSGRWARRRCWEGRAWAREQRGEMQSARYAYEYLVSEFDKPLPLAGFLARRGRCIELQELIGRTESSDDDANQRRLNRLNQWADRCSTDD